MASATAQESDRLRWFPKLPSYVRRKGLLSTATKDTPKKPPANNRAAIDSCHGQVCAVNPDFRLRVALEYKSRLKSSLGSQLLATKSLPTNPGSSYAEKRYPQKIGAMVTRSMIFSRSSLPSRAVNPFPIVGQGPSHSRERKI